MTLPVLRLKIALWARLILKVIGIFFQVPLWMISISFLCLHTYYIVLKWCMVHVFCGARLQVCQRSPVALTWVRTNTSEINSRNVPGIRPGPDPGNPIIFPIRSTMRRICLLKNSRIRDYFFRRNIPSIHQNVWYILYEHIKYKLYSHSHLNFFMSFHLIRIGTAKFDIMKAKLLQSCS